ncbi:hypothetical protein RRG08_015797 [Elysia crispata]|uniref:Uncharacterized protein n=1 Tax=Elysia crispata TaxID=231223 RepID=A0AAE1BA02_9GAST|nr:hypothetical protein RRG08_015797 [Elysia crispata]
MSVILHGAACLRLLQCQQTAREPKHFLACPTTVTDVLISTSLPHQSIPGVLLSSRLIGHFPSFSVPLVVPQWFTGPQETALTGALGVICSGWAVG